MTDNSPRFGVLCFFIFLNMTNVTLKCIHMKYYIHSTEKGEKIREKVFIKNNTKTNIHNIHKKYTNKKIIKLYLQMTGKLHPK